MKIYLSSTDGDLGEYRAAVTEALVGLGHEVLEVEGPASADRALLESRLEVLRSSDVYLGIFAWRYGPIPPGETRSVPELEYRAASDKPRLIFFLHPDATWDVQLTDAFSEGGGERILALRRELQEQHVVGYFRTVQELAAQAVAACQSLRDRPRRKPGARAPVSAASCRLFISYAREDEELRSRFEVALAPLKREGLVYVWHDRRITPGADFTREISQHLEESDLFVPLVSPDFLNSDYCYDVEMKRAKELHDARQGRIVPVILRPCDFQGTPFAKLNLLPRDGTPVVKWEDRDDAWLSVTSGIRAAVRELSQSGPGRASRGPRPTSIAALSPSSPVPALLDDQVLGFLRRYGKWGFNPVRIVNWGGQQPGFERLAGLRVEAVTAALRRLVERGDVRTFTAKKSGVTLYQYRTTAR